jgi:hypothetical protein
MVALRYGSSERYSKLRPAMGERAMLTPGPSRKLTLRARASLPSLRRARGRTVIPCGGERHAAGVGGGGSPGAHAYGGVGHFEAGQVDDGHGVRVHAVDAADQLDLLLEGEFGQHGLGLGFNCGRVGHRRLDGVLEVFHDRARVARWGSGCTQ